jgi:hypothetical protein
MLGKKGEERERMTEEMSISELHEYKHQTTETQNMSTCSFFNKKQENSRNC